PSDGFYEWKGEGHAKVPYFVRMRDREPFAFAGLWESWTGPNGEEMETAAIVTTDANSDIAHIHHRMPVILPPDAYNLWLDCAHVDSRTAQALTVPTRAGRPEAHVVSKAVDRVVNDDVSLTEPAFDAPEALAVRAAPSSAKRRPKTVE